MFFETYFDLWAESTYGEKEVAVCCPFPHVKADGTPYYDHNPSASVNLQKRVWNCKACGRGGNEVQMIQELFGCTSARARKFLNMLQRNISRETLLTQRDGYELTDDLFKQASNIGMYDKNVLEALDIMVEKVNDHYEYSIPVYYMGMTVDVRTYRPGCTPKVLSEEGAPSGLIIPYDIWEATAPNKWTLLMAGEKDMVCARSVGFNAITLTGGEVSTPINPRCFKGRRVAICYDNDDAGRMGARKVAKAIAPYADEVRIVDGFHKEFSGTDTKEDFTDWVLHYGGTKERMIGYIQAANKFEVADADADDEYPLVSLSEAIKPEYYGRILRSTVQILTTSDTPFDVPLSARLKKVVDGKGRLRKGDSVTWSLEDDAESLFGVIGVGLGRIEDAIKTSMHLAKEPGVVIDILSRETVWLCQVSDVGVGYDSMSELTAYCLGCKPVQGKKYTLRFLRTTDTQRGVVAMIVDSMEDAVDDISTFTINEDTKESLLYAQNVEGSVAERISHRAQAIRGLLGYEANEDLLTAIDLSFNTVEAFNYGNNTDVRGYMDTLVIGESRVGKSDTAKTLQRTYSVGGFVSLAGTAATLAGIVGGSVKDALGKQSTRAGVIPRYNKNLLVFEELAKAKDDIIRSLTDVRSSGLARITRVSGSIEMPASERMITLSNTRALPNGETRPIAEYASGLEITKDLIGTAEDIARYDMVFILGDDGSESDPLYDPPEAYPEHVLRNLIRWTWSRKANQIKFVDNSDRLIRDKAKALNDEYPIHIKLFGTECWKKLARLSIAASAYTVSTDNTYENILVTPEHVEWAYNFMKKIYDNDTFKLRAVVAEHKAKSTINEQDTRKLQEMYIAHKRTIDKLYEQSKMDKKTFKELAGIDDKEFAPLIRTLIARDFVNSDREMMYVTMKFKRTYTILRKEVEVPTV